MGIGKSKITPSINVDDMLKKAESNHELEAEKQDRVRLRWFCRKLLVVPMTLSTAFAMRL